jgi:type IV pilus assembly protein PilO
MSFDELRNLDLENPGSWPFPVKLVASLLLVALVSGAGWYFDWQHQIDSLQRAQNKETELRQQFEIKQKRAANLADYQRQLDEMRKTFGAMLRQLPSRAEVSKLLVDISQTGLATGLEFDLFKPQTPQKREFYAELPVSITVHGSYEEFARFVSGVANLPRIVTLHDIEIKTAGKSKGDKNADDGTDLVMNLTAKTYWYLEEEDGKK